MEDLERCGEFIIDNKNLAIIRTDNMSSIRFDFDNMYLYEANKKSQRKPIRYDSNEERILYWVAQSWKSYGEDTNEAIIKLFNNYHERTILGQKH